MITHGGQVGGKLLNGSEKSEITFLLINRIKEFCTLWLYCQYITVKYGLTGRRHLLLLDGADEELAYYALAHLGELKTRFYLRSVTVLIWRSTPFLCAYAHQNRIIIKTVGTIRYNRIFSVYRMFGRYIRPVSLDRPLENGMHNLVGVKGITKEDLVCLAFYQLFQYKRVEPFEEVIKRADTL